MSQALAAHDAIVRNTVEARHGTVVKMIGDGVHAVFDDAVDAVAATLDIQRAFTDPAATCGVALRVRRGPHRGVVERRDNDYFGSPVSRAARIMSAAHGGQVLLSETVADCVREILPAAVSLRDLGKVRLKDFSTFEHVYQVVHADLRQEFPALRSARGNTEQPAAASDKLHRPCQGVAGVEAVACRHPPADAHRLRWMRQDETWPSGRRGLARAVPRRSSPTRCCANARC